MARYASLAARIAIFQWRPAEAYCPYHHALPIGMLHYDVSLRMHFASEQFGQAPVALAIIDAIGQ